MLEFTHISESSSLLSYSIVLQRHTQIHISSLLLLILLSFRSLFSLKKNGKKKRQMVLDVWILDAHSESFTDDG